MFVRSLGLSIAYIGGAWTSGEIRATAVLIDGQQVLGPRTAGIGSPVNGATVDAEARAAIAAILSALRHHGLIET